ncbi:hypothetical protein E2C01_070646 [Portunus trituberculatus]|uniref:Uncharacterized protein n=1 Tax=Portunus trituberculatus TaxID=210409 RepID=A0A5B7I2U3_PORTR|nr:hypothetical protein [Portunus trituberculatus]
MTPLVGPQKYVMLVKTSCVTAVWIFPRAATVCEPLRRLRRPACPSCLQAWRQADARHRSGSTPGMEGEESKWKRTAITLTKHFITQGIRDFLSDTEELKEGTLKSSSSDEKRRKPEDIREQDRQQPKQQQVQHSLQQYHQ